MATYETHILGIAGSSPAPAILLWGFQSFGQRGEVHSLNLYNISIFSVAFTTLMSN